MTQIIAHAITRAQERYGITLTLLDLQRLAGQCERGEAVLLAIDPDGSKHMLVRHGETIMLAIYAPLSRIIITFLPCENRINRRRKWKRMQVGKRERRRDMAEMEEGA